MRRPLRLALVVVGLVAVVYDTATLTGRWLGTPPRWERVRYAQLVDLDELERSGTIRLTPYEFPPSSEHPSWIEPGLNRYWISGGVVTVGLGLVAFGAWPCSSSASPPPSTGLRASLVSGSGNRRGM